MGLFEIGDLPKFVLQVSACPVLHVRHCSHIRAAKDKLVLMSSFGYTLHQATPAVWSRRGVWEMSFPATKSTVGLPFGTFSSWLLSETGSLKIKGENFMSRQLPIYASYYITLVMEYYQIVPSSVSINNSKVFVINTLMALDIKLKLLCMHVKFKFSFDNDLLWKHQ